MNNLTNKKPTVTIGIPAYNEEANIEYLLKSILDQKQDNFIFKKIIIVSDGSTDKTVEIVQKLAKKNKLIKIIKGRIRKGKSARLNQMRLLNTSDIVVNFDADVLLSDTKVLCRMVSGFKKDIVMVSGCNLPIKGDTFVQKITAAGDFLWYEIRSRYKNGNNIYNSSGCSTALTKDFAQKFRYPKGVVADQQYIFHKVKEMGKKFKFVNDALVLYRSPDNLQDYFSQAHRSLTEKYPILEALGNNLEKEYKIPISYKIKALILCTIKNPIFTPLAICLAVWLRIFPPQKDNLNTEGVWKMVTSTKKAINQTTLCGN